MNNTNKIVDSKGDDLYIFDKFEEEEGSVPSVPSVQTPEPISLCKCLLSGDSSQEEIISERKKYILSTVARTENYLRERRIPELIRFLMTKIIASRPTNPAHYLENLMDKCMIFRAGLGVAPVLYENRHLEAVVNSFDPGRRGWLSHGQVRRAFTTLGLAPPQDRLDERIPTDVVLNNLRKTQERELLSLLSAGMEIEKSDKDSRSTSSI